MQKCEFDDPIKKKENLNAILMHKMNQIEAAIRESDFDDALELLDDAYHLCVDAGEMDLAVPFFEQLQIFKAKLGKRPDRGRASAMQGVDPGIEPEESKKREGMRGWLKAMLLLSMRKNLARFQKYKQVA